MKPECEELMMRALGDEMSPAQREAFAALLAGDAGLRAEFERLRRVQELVSRTRADAFEPFFATRVLARIRARRQESLADGLVRLFRPLVPLSLLVALALVALNLQDRTLMGDGASLVEAAFAMPAASVETAQLLDL